MTPLHAPDDRAHVEVDLDTPVVDPSAGTGRGRSLLPALLVVALLALAGASAVRTALTPPPAPPKPSVTATYTLRDVVPAGDGEPARADLVVTVTNRTDDVRTVDSVLVRGPRHGTQEPEAGRPGAFAQTGLQPQDSVRVVVRRDLDCSAPEPPPGRRPVEVVVAVSGIGDLDAVPVGDAAAQDGLCQALYQQAPRVTYDGTAQVPGLTGTVEQDGDRLRLDLVGLPDGITVGSVRAGSWPLPVVSSTGRTRGGLHLVLDRPTSGCDLVRRTDPVPLALTVSLTFWRTETAGDTTAVHADGTDQRVTVGPALARWLIAGSERCEG